MSPRAIPRDLEAERGTLACILQGAMDDRIDYRLWSHEGLRLLVQRLDEHKAEGLWYVPRSTHPGHELEAAQANAETLCHVVELDGSWPCASNVRHELFIEVMSLASAPSLLSHYVDRLIECHTRRERIEQLETELAELYRWKGGAA
jgi:hypothetical protein